MQNNSNHSFTALLDEPDLTYDTSRMVFDKELIELSVLEAERMKQDKQNIIFHDAYLTLLSLLKVSKFDEFKNETLSELYTEITSLTSSVDVEDLNALKSLKQLGFVLGKDKKLVKRSELVQQQAMSQEMQLSSQSNGPAFKPK